MNPERGPNGASAELLRIREACAVLSISRTTLYRLFREGRIAFVRLGGSVRVPRSETDRIAREGA